MTPTPVSPRRTIRSFVLRQGRMTSGQKLALEDYWTRFGIPFARHHLALDAEFGRPAPKVLEIGAGMGDSCVHLAEQHPENDYLAIEVHQPGVGSLIRQAVQTRLGNIRVIRRDVVEVLRFQIPPRSLDEVYLFFPDPWPKKRHHKRRLLTPAFLTLLVPCMKTHGRLLIATDQGELAEYMLGVCDACPGLENLAGNGRFSPRPRWRPWSKFERRAHDAARRTWDLAYAVTDSSNASKEPNALNSPDS